MAEPLDKSKERLQLSEALTDPAASRRCKKQAALLSIVSNTILVLLKIGVGVWSGSVSVLSEAAHSSTDLMASVIAYLSVRASDTPPDEEHPYGHGKIESVSSLAEALLIFAAALYVVYEAVVKLLARSAQPPTVEAAIVVMGLSIVVNFFLSRHLKKVAQDTDSMALEADAEHLRSDVLTSLGVLIGLILTRLTHAAWLDPVTGLVVALFLFRAAYRLSYASLQPLLDTRLPDEEVDAIKRILEDDPRVLGYHKLRTRKSGSQRHADVHVQIDDDCTLLHAHDLAEELEDRIRAALPAIHINTHMEPFYEEMRHQREVHGLTELSSPAVHHPASKSDSEKRS